MGGVWGSEEIQPGETRTQPSLGVSHSCQARSTHHSSFPPTSAIRPTARDPSKETEHVSEPGKAGEF